jgi:hypothetical protein
MMPTSLSLSEVAVSGGRRLAFNTISAADIRLRTTRSAQDLLRMVPGLFNCPARRRGQGRTDFPARIQH